MNAASGRRRDVRRFGRACRQHEAHRGCEIGDDLFEDRPRDEPEALGLTRDRFVRDVQSVGSEVGRDRSLPRCCDLGSHGVAHTFGGEELAECLTQVVMLICGHPGAPPARDRLVPRNDNTHHRGARPVDSRSCEDEWQPWSTFAEPLLSVSISKPRLRLVPVVVVT